MPPPSTKPKVFISSTIYDFADTRSALKYWLEELGYEVYASEFNAFPKDFNDNSYNACLEALRQSDYFILLIGGRAGGWHNEESKTTITMQEYRCAYELAKQGTLKIATFVRSKVWDAREDRTALKRVLAKEYASEHNLTPEDIEKIAYHRSKVISDADVIFNFLDEVARNTEMKDAIKGQGALPLANWIHQFSSFRDIIDALKGTFIKTQGMRRVILGENLRLEILDHLRTAFLFRFNENDPINPLYYLCGMARTRFSGNEDGTSYYQKKDLSSANLFFVFSSVILDLHTNALDKAIDSGEFLEFDITTNKYKASAFHKALRTYRNELSRAKFIHESFSPELFVIFRDYGNSNEEVRFPNEQLGPLFALYDRHWNLLALSTYILKTLDRTPHPYPNLRPRTPFTDQVDGIEKTTLSDEEILGWINTPMED